MGGGANGGPPSYAPTQGKVGGENFLCALGGRRRWTLCSLAPYLWVARRCLPVDISAGQACLEIFVYVRIGYGTLPIIGLRWIHIGITGYYIT